MLQASPSWLDAITGIGGIVAILAVVIPAYRKWVGPWLRRRHARKLALEQTLMGRDEIRDPATGKVLAPAVPALGVRIGTMESAFQKMSDAFASLSDTHRLIADLSTRVDLHDEKIAALERAQMDRIAIQAQTAATLNLAAKAHATGPSSAGSDPDADTED